jgi:hypothetical protein
MSPIAITIVVVVGVAIVALLVANYRISLRNRYREAVYGDDRPGSPGVENYFNPNESQSDIADDHTRESGGQGRPSKYDGQDPFRGY